MGKCPCGKPVSSNNRARCKACSNKEAKRLAGTYQAAIEKGWCGACRAEKKSDGHCKQCAENYVRRRLRSLKLFQTKVQGLPEDAPIQCNRCHVRLDIDYQCVCFTLHHERYLDPKRPMKKSRNTLTFDTCLELHGEEWFQEEETMEVLCRSCHAVEHASTTASDSKWADLHWQVVELFNCACECGLSYNDEVVVVPNGDGHDGNDEKENKLKKMFHIHHVHSDGADKRRNATEEIDENRKSVSDAANEYMLILDLEGKELKDKLKEYRCLCDPCHYYFHIEQNVKSEIVRLGLEKQIKEKLWGNLLERQQQ